MKRGQRVIFETTGGVMEGHIYNGPCGTYVRSFIVPQPPVLCGWSVKTFIEEKAREYNLRPEKATGTAHAFDLR